MPAPVPPFGTIASVPVVVEVVAEAAEPVTGGVVEFAVEVVTPPVCGGGLLTCAEGSLLAWVLRIRGSCNPATTRTATTTKAPSVI